MGSGKRLAGGKSRKKPEMSQFSKWMVADIRPLLWIVTVGGLLLAAYCIRVGYTGSLPWISAMVGLPWTAHGVVCTAYLSLCKSDHKEGGITYEAATGRSVRRSTACRMSQIPSPVSMSRLRSLPRSR